MDDRIEELEAEVRDLWAQVFGMTALFSALMRTHPHFDHMQLRVTADLEWLLNRPPGQALTDEQRTAARNYVESLQTLAPDPVPQPTPPERSGRL